MMDQLSLQRIETAHPILRVVLRKAYIEANNRLGKGVRLRLAWVYRYPKEQRKMFLQRPKITNADEWMSFHQYGLAFDTVLLYDNNGDGVFEEASWNTKRDGDNDGIADWLEVTLVFEEYGFKNGFLKNGKKWDLPHFQKTFGYTVRQLRKMIIDKNTIIDNGITYPNIIIK
jgi:peptidoglycan LD-endopeptidase CwlK